VYSATAPTPTNGCRSRAGTDAALGLAVARHLLDVGAIDLPYVREQTDLPLLVRLDNGRFLRAEDLVSDSGSETQLYLWHPQKNEPVPAPAAAAIRYAQAGAGFRAADRRTVDAR
jgi:anaerobic selenocysteine-containing dehydrogenase